MVELVFQKLSIYKINEEAKLQFGGNVTALCRSSSACSLVLELMLEKLLAIAWMK